MAEVPRIHRKSTENAPSIGRPIPPASGRGGGKGGRIPATVMSRQGRSFGCDPRQLIYDFRGFHIIEVLKDGPDAFRREIGSTGKGPLVVVGRYRGKPGAPTSPPQWSEIPKDRVPSGADGLLAWLSSQAGSERCFENMVSFRTSGPDKRGVTATHISDPVDRELIEINEDDWETKFPERALLIDQLSRIPPEDIEEARLSHDRRTLHLELVYRPRGGRVSKSVDVSCLRLDRLKMFDQQGDAKFSVKLIAIDPLLTAEVRKRETVLVRYHDKQAIENDYTVECHRKQDRTYRVKIEFTKDPARAPVILSGKTIKEIKASPDYARLGKPIQESVVKLCKETPESPFWEDSRPVELRKRYYLKFYEHRESCFKEDVLERPLEDGERVTIIKVLGALKVVHIDDRNGRPPGTVEVVPVNFDPHCGHPEDHVLIRSDPRPHARVGTRIIMPVGTTLTGQHLLSPYLPGTNVLAAEGPLVDQRGFFGVFMLALASYPFGAAFADPRHNPWWVKLFASTSHSIFDAKSAAGVERYFFSGYPRSRKMATGMAIVTGPNTVSVNPAREGRLIFQRIPGMRPFMIKSMIDSPYLSVIEDAQSSYLEMTMDGIITITTVYPLSGGGGVDNYQLARVQRSLRWNAGIILHVADSGQEIAADFFCSGSIYRFCYNAARKLYTHSGSPIDDELSVRKDILGSLTAEAPAKDAKMDRVYDGSSPITPKFELGEAHEALGVGSWYLFPFGKVFLALTVVNMVVLSLLAIPVSVPTFLAACLAQTIICWPFWAVQMMKTGVDPEDILSLRPIQIFWQNILSYTMAKMGLEIEWLGVGKFRISEKSYGNRHVWKDKRFAFWVMAALPIAGGAAFTTAMILIAGAVGFKAIAVSTGLFLLGRFLTKKLFRPALKRLLPNPNYRSLGRSLVHSLIGGGPLILGIFAAGYFFAANVLIAIPVMAALMVGFWALFSGCNVFNVFLKYHRDQMASHTLESPNPKTIARPLVDTWRNTINEAMGCKIPEFTVDEFTRSNDPDIDPYRLWQAVNTAHPGLLQNPGANPIKNLNSLIKGEATTPKEIEFYLTDLYHEFGCANMDLPRQIRRLAAETAGDRAFLAGLPRARRLAGFLLPQQYNRIAELNRLVMGEVYRRHTPRKKVTSWLSRYL